MVASLFGRSKKKKKIKAHNTGYVPPAQSQHMNDKSLPIQMKKEMETGTRRPKTLV